MAEVNRFMGPFNVQEQLSSEDIARRLHTMVDVGVITSVNHVDTSAMVSIRGEEFGPFKWLENWTHGDISWNAPNIGQQVMILNRSGRYENGVIIGGIYTADDKPELEDGKVTRTIFGDGTVVFYDKEDHILRVHVPAEAGEIQLEIGDEQAKFRLTKNLFEIVAGGKTMTLNSTGLHVNGNIEDTNGTMQEMRTTYNTHTHPENSNTTTSAPNQQMN